jgi:hypothetical protein
MDSFKQVENLKFKKGMMFAAAMRVILGVEKEK